MKTTKLFIALLSVLLSVAVAGTAGADILYTTVKEGKGAFGAITVTGTASLDIVSIDAGLSTEIRVLACGKRYPSVVIIDPLTSPDTARFYNQGNWSSAPSIVKLERADDLRSIDESSNGGSLFAASYGNASLLEYSLSSYTPTNRRFTYTSPQEGYTPHIRKVLVTDRSVYGLFTLERTIDSGDLPSRVIAFDGQLRSDLISSNNTVGLNATDMTSFGGGIAISYLGGTQNGVTRGSGISILGGGSPISGDDYGRIETLCRDNDNGLYFTTLDDDGTITLMHWTSSTGSQIVNTYTGTFSQLAWDSSRKTLILATDDLLLLSGDLGVRSFTSADLGGTLTSIAFTSPASEWKETSSGGCVAASLPLALCLLPVLALLRRRQ